MENEIKENIVTRVKKELVISNAVDDLASLQTAKDKLVDLLAHRWQLATVTSWAYIQMTFS